MLRHKKTDKFSYRFFYAGNNKILILVKSRLL